MPVKPTSKEEVHAVKIKHSSPICVGVANKDEDKVSGFEINHCVVHGSVASAKGNRNYH